MKKIAIFLALIGVMYIPHACAVENAFGDFPSGQEQYYMGTSFADDYEVQQLDRTIAEKKNMLAMPTPFESEKEPLKKEIRKLEEQRAKLIREKIASQKNLGKARQDTWKVQYTEPSPIGQ